MSMIPIDPPRFIGYEVAPVKREHACWTVCDPADAEQWTLYGILYGIGLGGPTEGRAYAIGDFASRGAALEVLSMIVGRPVVLDFYFH